ncbi:cyclin-like protein [Peziza echinospora]|nr:cyclin-like protein [Peziza echinospora]
MNSRRVTRQRSVVTHDENTTAAVTRLTRAKALANENAAPLGAKQANSTVPAAVPGRKRAALGNVSNNGRKAEDKENVDEKLLKKALGGKVVLSTKASATNGVHKLTTRQSAKAPLKATITEEVNEKDARRGNGSGVMGARKKRIISSELSKIQETTVTTAKAVIKPLKEDKPAPPTRMTAVEIKAPEVKETHKAVAQPKKRVVQEAKPPPVDFDDDDEHDPLMVSEYAVEIFQYLRELEDTTQPNPDYMEAQEGLHWDQRGILVDWLIEVHTKFHLLPETLYLAINIIDRFLSVKVVMIDRLQLVGITAMFIAAKYEEVFSPHIGHFRYLADDTFSEEEILRAERFMLQSLDYNLSYPNPMNFLRRISKADNYDIHTRTVAKYLMEISLVDYKLMEYLPSQIAAASMYLSRMILRRGPWDSALIHYSGYTEDDIRPIFLLMFKYIHRPAHKAFFNKYASKKYAKASILAREWAKEMAPAILPSR